MKHVLLLFSLFIVITLTGCINLFGEDEPIEAYLNDMQNEYLRFPVGSQWIYEDSATGNLDTLKLITATTQTIEDTDDNINREELYLEFQSSFYNNNNRAYTLPNEFYYLDIPPKGAYTPVFHAYPDDSVNASPGFLVRYTLDSLIVLEKKYTIVLKFNRTQFQHNLLPKYTYFAPRVGLIKIEMFNRHIIWNLKEFYINE